MVRDKRKFNKAAMSPGCSEHPEASAGNRST